MPLPIDIAEVRLFDESLQQNEIFHRDFTINYGNEIIIYSHVVIAQLYTVSISDKINKRQAFAKLPSSSSSPLLALSVFRVELNIASFSSACGSSKSEHDDGEAKNLFVLPQSETVVTNFYYIINELRGGRRKKSKRWERIYCFIIYQQ